MNADFTVLVTHTDRTRTPDGNYTTFHAVVHVLADNQADATCIAAQMVAAVRCDIQDMVLDTTITDIAI